MLTSSYKNIMQLQGDLGFWSHYTNTEENGWLTIIYVQPKQLNYKAGCKFQLTS